MGLIDTHTHLETFARAGTLEGVLARARDAGVESMITVGTSPDDWSLYRDLADRGGSLIHYTVGLHPCSVDGSWREVIAGMEAFWASPVRPVALGEIGLDRFHLPKDDPAQAEQIFGWQRAAFAEGLKLARKLDCPVVIHSRGAFPECIQVLDASGVDWRKVVFHCFVEGEAEMTEIVKRGGFGSFTGILTYKSAESVRAAAKMQGLGRFMVETDAPYLTPMPLRGKPNEPAYVRHTADFAAAMFGVSPAELQRISTANARAFYALKPG